MKYFTSDWHLGDDRIGINGKPNLFYRPFNSVYEQNAIITNLFCSTFKDGDELWHLGDVVYNNCPESWDILNTIRHRFPNSKFNLIVGNYDEDKLDVLGNYFDRIMDSREIYLNDHLCYLNHYPAKCRDNMEGCDLSITGHIHGLWKVQPKMINVGVDAWHFKPVSENEILFCWTAMQKFYDENVFPYKIK